MQLANFLNNLFIKDGFILIDANNIKYKIGNSSKENPIKLKILDKSLHFKLLYHPDFYFGEAYTNGSLIIENGSLTDFLEIAFQNIGTGEVNKYGMIMNKLRGVYRTLTNFNFVKIFFHQSSRFMTITMIRISFIKIRFRNSMIGGNY